MVATEEQIHALTPALDRLARALENLSLPDAGARSLLDVTVDTTDVMAEPALEETLAGWPVRHRTFPVAPASPATAPSDVDLWRPVLGSIAWFEHARFAVRSAKLSTDGATIDTELALAARGRLLDDSLVEVSGRIDARWLKRRLLGEAQWRLAAWHTRSLEWLAVERPLFREVLDAALPDPETRRLARRSRHEELVEARLRDADTFRPPHPHFFQGSQDRHPGIAVADVNGDGFDDLYVMARWGPNQLFVNRGDGRFDERAETFGLAIRDHSAAAVFADFDNDGDDDLFLGRTLVPSQLFENQVAENGRFIERGATAFGAGRLPGLVSSVAAVDYDNDGWLDIYVSTYAAQMLVVDRTEQLRRSRSGKRVHPSLLGDHLPAEDAGKLFALSATDEAHLYLALPGPPNVVLRNLGDGRFEAVAPDHPLRSFRNTYQATFADFDVDGDQDVYLAHDFAPNQLLRNDGAGTFVDVTDETGTADIGFGMGASWGDYDGDGREDLYVSNMYSKAGKRVTGFFDRIDSRFEKMARGNTLFRNTEGGFVKVSGESPPAVPVEAAGWAWGGQWADWSNDGALDLYALSGYYTAPALVQSDVDI